MPLGTILLILIVIAAVNGIMTLLGLRPPDDLPVLLAIVLIAVLLVALDHLAG